MRKMVPFGMVVPTLRRPASSVPSFVGGEALRRPHVDARCARAADKGVLAELVDVHDGPAAGVMTGNDASYLQCHVWPPGSAAEPHRQMVTRVVDRVGPPAAVPVPACTGFGDPEGPYTLPAA